MMPAIWTVIIATTGYCRWTNLNILQTTIIIAINYPNIIGIQRYDCGYFGNITTIIPIIITDDKQNDYWDGKLSI